MQLIPEMVNACMEITTTRDIAIRLLDIEVLSQEFSHVITEDLR